MTGETLPKLQCLILRFLYRTFLEGLIIDTKTVEFGELMLICFDLASLENCSLYRSSDSTLLYFS